jgi:hypothetical protein
MAGILKWLRKRPEHTGPRRPLQSPDTRRAVRRWQDFASLMGVRHGIVRHCRCSGAQTHLPDVDTPTAPVTPVNAEADRLAGAHGERVVDTVYGFDQVLRSLTLSARRL